MTLDRVPWFGRHVENFGDVIVFPVLVVARTVVRQALIEIISALMAAFRQLFA